MTYICLNLLLRIFYLSQHVLIPYFQKLIPSNNEIKDAKYFTIHIYLSLIRP